jgi:hypothetical protein
LQSILRQISVAGAVAATTKASARRLDYLNGSIMGGILGRTLSHDVGRAWGFVVRAGVGHAGRLKPEQCREHCRNDFGTFFGTFCSQFGTFVPFYSQNPNLAILAAPLSSLF